MDTYGHSGYSVPTYQSEPGAIWYHFLHGNVPGHQIDFIFRPEVPRGDLTRQHFSHLARLMKYIEPRVNASYAFSIGNLSRDDSQYEPGHAGLALIFGLRIKGAVDHAGRRDPPFCHAVVSVDRQFDETTVCEAAVQFHDQLLARPNAPSDGARWYQSYVLHAQRFAASTLGAMHAYVRSFQALPAPAPSDLGLRWTVDGGAVARRVVIVYPDGTPFGAIAQQMARIAAILIESDIRWTAISTGREQDLAGGTTVRFVPESEAVHEPDDVVSMHIRQIPGEPREIAMLLFGAHEVRLSVTNRLRVQWRQRGETLPPEVLTLVDSPAARMRVQSLAEAEKNANMDSDVESPMGLARPNDEPATKKKRRGMSPALQFTLLIVGIFVVVAMAVTWGWSAARRSGIPEAGPQAPEVSRHAAQTAEPVPFLEPTTEAPKEPSETMVAPEKPGSGLGTTAAEGDPAPQAVKSGIDMVDHDAPVKKTVRKPALPVRKPAIPVRNKVPPSTTNTAPKKTPVNTPLPTKRR